MTSDTNEFGQEIGFPLDFTGPWLHPQSIKLTGRTCYLKRAAPAQRLGFQFEGIFRYCTHYKGRNRDTTWFAIIDADWPALKARFTEYLGPTNFDAQDHHKFRCAGSED